jgi:CRISPR-associated Csx14 family protein
VAVNYKQHNQSAVLIATLGTEPQVVTAALDLLRQKGECIVRVEVLHTTSAGTQIEKAVQQLQAALDKLRDQDQIEFSLHPLMDAEGNLLADVRTAHESHAAFYQLYNQVRRAKFAGKRVHLCIAGGRKTLAVFGMATAQLLFDEGDRLWHLYSGGDFLESKRLHPEADDDTQLVPIPVILWSQVSPILTDLSSIEDPFEAVERVSELQLAERIEQARTFVLGALTPAERRAVALLVMDGLSDHEIADRLVLSPRTVESQLRTAYTKAAEHWELADVSRAQLIALLNLYYRMEITGNPA